MFGAKGDVKPNVVFIDEERLIYVAGNNLIEMGIDGRTQKIFPSKEERQVGSH